MHDASRWDRWRRRRVTMGVQRPSALQRHRRRFVKGSLAASGALVVGTYHPPTLTILGSAQALALSGPPPAPLPLLPAGVLTGSGQTPGFAGTTPGSCAPRPNVRVATTRLGNGQLQVTITAGLGSIQAVRFLRIDNATVSPGAPPLGSSQTAFTVTSTDANAAFTVQLEVTDDCGPWRT